LKVGDIVDISVDRFFSDSVITGKIISINESYNDVIYSIALPWTTGIIHVASNVVTKSEMDQMEWDLRYYDTGRY
jgi:hypothetical protein